MSSSELQDGLSRQFHQVQLLRCDNVGGAWSPAEDAQLPKIVSRPDRPGSRQKHFSLAAQDDVERVVGRSLREGSFASSKLGEGCVPDELAQSPLANPSEERERCEHLGPVGVTRAILVAQWCVHHAASCSARWANGW